MTNKKGFEPVFECESEILILGSFPSKMSFEVGFYYGHPRNRFWKMLEGFFKIKLENIESKKNFLLRYHIALWDIVSLGNNMQGGKESSMDKNLTPLEISNIDMLLSQTKIQRILCNGKKAYALLLKFYPHLKDRAKCLPSTSPANFRFDAKQWQVELLYGRF